MNAEPIAWCSAKAIAATAEVEESAVHRALRLTGLLWSKHHATGVGDARTYSPEAQALVLREVKGRGWDQR